MSARGITLAELKRSNELTERAIAELEAEHARGCRCDVALVEVRVLEGGGAIVSLSHESFCPRWIAHTS